MSKLGVGVIAAVALLGIDYFLAVVSFLYTSAPEWILFAWLFVFFAAVYLRLGWMVFIVHNLITIVLIIRLIQYYQSDMWKYDPANIGSLMFEVAVVVFTNFLAWLVVRGLPRRSWFPRAEEDHSAAGR